MNGSCITNMICDVEIDALTSVQNKGRAEVAVIIKSIGLRYSTGRNCTLSFFIVRLMLVPDRVSGIKIAFWAFISKNRNEVISPANIFFI